MMEKVSFVSQLQPVLKSGEYTLDLKQQVKSNEGVTPVFASELYHITKNLMVAGERFRIEAPAIQSQYPPADKVGDYAAALPQIVLNRATLPWERNAVPAQDEVPWMMVVVIYESELINKSADVLRGHKLDQYVTYQLGDQAKILLKAEIGQAPDEQVDVLLLKKNVAAKLIPDAQGLKLLSSVRNNIKADGTIVTELATCFANRLPAIGERSYAFLISLESRYDADGNFNYFNGVDHEERVVLIALASWSFSCPDETAYELNSKSIASLVAKGLSTIKISTSPDETVEAYLNKTLSKNVLYRGTDVFKGLLPAIYGVGSIVTKTDQDKIADCLAAPTQTFEGILESMDKGTFKLDLPALNDQPFAQPYMQRSAIALKHHLREGEPTASWYHGPFITGKNLQTISESLLPIQSSDILYEYDMTINMLDVSYAAAWELGKLMMVNNPQAAAALQTWKQINIPKLIQAKKKLSNGHLPFTETVLNLSKQDDTLADWFNNLNLLQGVPFNYLVADELFLPDNSIRFFEIDNYWIDCLLDGAFSIGRVSKAEVAHDQQFRSYGAAPSTPYTKITGFLMRSEVVSGWPSLLVDGYGTLQSHDNMEGTPLEVLRMERISPNLFICLFNGEIKTIDIHLKPESLHMGYYEPDEKHTDYYKKLRNLITGAEMDKMVTITWTDATMRIIDVKQQSGKIKQELEHADNLNAGQFSLEMMTGVPRVRFNAKA